MRIAFDRLRDEAGIHPIIQAEVDDMAMMRVVARESDAVALVPPIVVGDELAARTLSEYCPVPWIWPNMHGTRPDQNLAATAA